MPCLTMGSLSLLMLFLALAPNRFLLLEAYEIMLSEKACNGQTILPTDSSFSSVSLVSGQLIMPEKPWTINCTLTLVFHDYCPSQKRSGIAFYYNLREFGLRANESMQVWEKQGGDYKLRKILSNVEVTNEAPRSYDQFRTEYSFRPVVKFVFNLTCGSPKVEGNGFFHIDWTILSESYKYSTRVCEALNGYVAEKLVCGQDVDADRVYCPYEYNGTASGADPVLQREWSSRQTCAPLRDSSTASTVDIVSEKFEDYFYYARMISDLNRTIFFLGLTLGAVLFVNLLYCCNRCCRSGKKEADRAAERENVTV